MFYVSLEDLNRKNVSEVMLEYYTSGKMSDDEEVSESNVEEVAGENQVLCPLYGEAEDRASMPDYCT